MRIEVSHRMIQDALKFGEMSEADLKVAEITYESEFYPHAVFHMQQSVEKMVKAFLLVLGIKKSMGEVKELGHNMLEMQEEILELSRYASETMQIVGWMPSMTGEEYLDRISTSEAEFKDLSTESGRKKLLAISQDERGLKKMLNKLDGLYRDLEKRLNRPVGFNRLNNLSLPEAQRFQASIRHLDPKERNLVLKSTQSCAKVGIICFPHLVGFAVIFYPHVSLTRYPSEDNWNPLDFYTEELPLIKMLPKFVDRMKKNVVDNFQEFMSKYHELAEVFSKEGNL